MHAPPEHEANNCSEAPLRESQKLYVLLLACCCQSDFAYPAKCVHGSTGVSAGAVVVQGWWRWPMDGKESCP
ncbi:hypothetical protein GUJ93_ZPchr0001g30458 [Zizania palustris]|uniref:Uncharacterized protein n=1 Tax=Zizania palustris TaxID=103762 RepID=A0A8J5RVA9_ZIZPA|nr:hypothetical protein GUJ93_ZPchr0001g30458 [Zizania palustris]